MNKEKMTYAKALEKAIAAVENEEVKEKLKALKASIDKKNSAEKKPTAQQKENAELRDKILNAMEPDVSYTISAMIKTFDFLADFSTSKVSALVRQLKEEGKVKREVIKRVAFFSLAD